MYTYICIYPPMTDVTLTCAPRLLRPASLFRRVPPPKLRLTTKVHFSDLSRKVLFRLRSPFLQGHARPLPFAWTDFAFTHTTLSCDLSLRLRPFSLAPPRVSSLAPSGDTSDLLREAFAKTRPFRRPSYLTTRPHRS